MTTQRAKPGAAGQGAAEDILRQAAAAGLTLEDLITAARPDATLPTVSEFRPRVEAAASESARSTYRTYWNVLEEAYGTHRLDQVTTTDLKVVSNQVTTAAKAKGGHGRSAAEHFVSSSRCFFRTAVEDGLIASNPAAKVEKPRRLKGRRRMLTETEMRELMSVVRVGSDDPDLDHLICWFHVVTGARRAGALNLTLADLDDRRQTVWLTEKYNARREQPVTRELIEALRRHAGERGATGPKDRVFHYKRHKDGSPHPLTFRRYNTLFPRLQRLLPFAATASVDSHTLRKTAIALVERASSHEVARKFAGHAESNVTSHYAEASIEEVAAVVSYLHGQPHPLAPRAGSDYERTN
jgi:integrase